MTNNNNNNNKEQYSNKRREYKAVPLLSGVEEIRQDFEERIAQGDTVYGVEILDDFVETIRKGSLTFILARPNCGKSLLGQIIACNLAKQGKRVLICSCEMGSGLLMERQLLNLTGVSMGQLKYLYANRRDMANKILDSVIEDNKYDYLKKIDIAETGGATVDDIMQLLDAEPECDYAIIDYIQRIKGQGSEYENITNAARELQTYARRTGKRLIICSQAKRPNTKDGSTTDASSAAKGSGSIEEDGDVGLLLSEVFENGDKKILATLFKNRYGAKQKTYKYRLDERLNIKLEEKDYE